jgi:SPP1 family predicted phage head-tail adaptor
MQAVAVALLTDSYGAGPGREVMADKLSVRQSEFYQAQQVGLRPTVVFRLMSAEYNEERTLLYGGRRYNVIRTYDRPDERTELTCEVVP